MNRRDLLKAAAALGAGLGVSARVEAAPDAVRDVVIIQCDKPICAEAAARIRDYAQSALNGVTVVVLGDGMRWHVERGILKIEEP